MAIADALASPTLLASLAAAATTRDYTGHDEIEKIYTLL